MTASRCSRLGTASSTPAATAEAKSASTGFSQLSTGADSPAIDWRFTVGDRIKIRLVNEMDSDHPMHHPFHIHGAGRFLILSRNGVVEPNLVWKDTVLLRADQTIDVFEGVK